MSNVEQRLIERGIALPEVIQPVGTYEPYIITGNLLYTSGAVPRAVDGTWMIGKVGLDFSAEQAYEHARLSGLQLLAVTKEALGDLNRVRRIVKVLGMVNAAPGFTQFTQVIDGCSDLFIEVLGEHGKHARSAVGVAGLPGNLSLEIEAIIEITP